MRQNRFSREDITYPDTQLFESGKEVVTDGDVFRANSTFQVVDLKAKAVNLSVKSIHMLWSKMVW